MQKSFSQSVHKWASGVRAKENRVVQGLVVFCLMSLADYTPVDTGRARASWRVGVNRINRDVDRRPERGAPGFAASQSAGDAVFAAQFVRARLELKAETVIWLTNDIPYVFRLEKGYSPKGRDMLHKTFGRAVIAWPQIVRENAGAGALA